MCNFRSTVYTFRYFSDDMHEGIDSHFKVCILYKTKNSPILSVNLFLLLFRSFIHSQIPYSLSHHSKHLPHLAYTHSQSMVFGNERISSGLENRAQMFFWGFFVIILCTPYGCRQKPDSVSQHEPHSTGMRPADFKQTVQTAFTKMLIILTLYQVVVLLVKWQKPSGMRSNFASTFFVCLS